MEFLRLERTRITDAGLESFKGLARLQRLYLDDTGITDAGLEHLKGLTELQHLSLSGTQVTDAGVRRLQQALPNLTIAGGPAQPTIRNTDQPTKLLDGTTADSEKPEQPRFAARTFSARTTLDAFVREDPGRNARKAVGRTPSVAPLEIPACWLW